MKKDSAKKPYDLNLIAVDDEALVLWAREAGWNPAEQELFVRYWKEAKRRIDREAEFCGLGRADTEDAEQETFFAAHGAIAGYKPRPTDRPDPGAFRSFLFLRLISRFHNMVRKRRRNESHVKRSVDVGSTVDPASYGLGDPARAAEAHEFWDRLHEAVDQLDGDLRQVYEGWLSGRTIKEIAASMNASPSKVKRLKQELKDKLQVLLKDWTA